MEMRSRTGELALAFGLVGGAAGWISAGVLASPLVDVAYGGKQALAAVCAGLVGAGIGALLTRVVAPQGTWKWQGDAWLRLAALVLPGGAITGALVGRITGWSLYGAATGALNGVLCAAAVLPLCALVLRAALRAQRARLGSIVADSDQRAVWQILAASLATATLAALPDWPAARLGEAPAPAVAATLALCASAVIATVLLFDAAALRRATRAASAAVEPRAPDADRDDATVPRVDLGLGDEVHARVDRGAAYRSPDRAVALVLGSPAASYAALATAITRGVACLGLSGAVLLAHGLARGNDALDLYRAARCARGHAPSCEVADTAGKAGIHLWGAVQRIYLHSMAIHVIPIPTDPQRAPAPTPGKGDPLEALKGCGLLH